MLQVGSALVLHSNYDVTQPPHGSGHLSIPSSPRTQRALLLLPANTSSSMRESRLQQRNPGFPSYSEPGFLCMPAPSALQWEPQGMARKEEETGGLLPCPAVQTPRGDEENIEMPQSLAIAGNQTEKQADSHPRARCHDRSQRARA